MTSAADWDLNLYSMKSLLRVESFHLGKTLGDGLYVFAQTIAQGLPTVASGNQRCQPGSQPALRSVHMTHFQALANAPMTPRKAVHNAGVRGWLLNVLAASAFLLTTGCAVTRGQETLGAYIDDSAITTAVKSHFFDNRFVDGTAISVETLNGTVMLSGFAKNGNEKATAEKLTWTVKGVKAVKNEIAVRP